MKKNFHTFITDYLFKTRKRIHCIKVEHIIDQLVTYFKHTNIICNLCTLLRYPECFKHSSKTKLLNCLFKYCSN